MTAPTLRVLQRRDDGSQIVGADAHVAVVDDEDFVLRFADQAGEFGHFVIDADASGAVEEADAAVGKIAGELLNNRDNRIVGRADAEEEFVIRVILAAQAGEVFVSFVVEAADGLQITDWRGEGGMRFAAPGGLEEAPGTKDGEQVVNAGKRRYEQ